MQHDVRGLALSTDSAEAAAAFNAAIADYLEYRLSAGEKVKQVLAADPDFAMGHILRGYFMLLIGSNATLPAAQKALAQAKSLAAGITPRELDVVELHDAFSIEEILYTEAFGLCGPGEGHHFLREGRSAVDGDCAINTSGGLIAQGHPLGPTGIGQIHEIVRQLRGENGNRQRKNARIGMAHMIGLGSVAIAHVFRND